MSAPFVGRVRLREPPSYSTARKEWRLQVESTDPTTMLGRYAIFVDVDERPHLDGRVLGLQISGAIGTLLLVQHSPRPRTMGSGATQSRRYASHLLALPPSAEAWSDDDAFGVHAEFREVLRRDAGTTAADAAETIYSVVEGIYTVTEESIRDFIITNWGE